MRVQNTLFVIGLMCATGAAHDAGAAGFYLQEQSARGQGAAFAGGAANPADATIIFNNPAGMTELKGPQGVAGLAVIMPKSEFTNTGLTTGNDGGNPFSPTPVPSFFFATPFGDGGMWGGLAITAPFGLANKYNPGWFGRYNSTENVLKTVNIAPSAAFKVSDAVSIGGGVNFEYANADLKQDIFTGGADDHAQVKGDSWDIGVNVGLLWNINPQTRAGLHYRSAITHHIEGSLNVSGPVNLGFTSLPAKAKLKLPDVVELGLTHDISPRLKLLGTVNWFGWDNFDEIRVDTALPDIVSEQDWRNTFAVAVGAEWKQDERWTYRGGLQFDQTPTGAHRDARVPDSNRFWVSLGASYAVNSRFSIDGAASHLFMGDADVNVSNQFGPFPAQTTSGTAENSATILSLQTVVKF
jgi:long-chain fatty acid transport protein